MLLCWVRWEIYFLLHLTIALAQTNNQTKSNMEHEKLNHESPTCGETAVCRSAVEPLVETLFMIATAPNPTNEFEHNSFVETAKMIAQKALDDFDKHFC